MAGIELANARYRLQRRVIRDRTPASRSGILGEILPPRPIVRAKCRGQPTIFGWRKHRNLISRLELIMARSLNIHRLPPLARFALLRVIPLIFVVAGLICAWFGVRTVLTARASLNWPTVPGVVVSSEVQQRKTNSRKSMSGQHGRRGSRTSYHASVRYEYDVDGVKHSSHRVMFGDYGQRDPARAQSIVDRYPAGKEVVVYYEPSAPETSTLEPGMQSGAYLLPGVGAIFLLIGTVTFVVLHVKFVLPA